MLPRIRSQRDSLDASRRRSQRRSMFLRIEELESRFLFSAGGLGNIFAAPDRGPGGGVTNPTPVGYDPAQIQHAYGFDQLSQVGAGQIIAIVDAFDDPNIFKDLDVFDQTFKANNNSSLALYDQYGAASSFLTKATPQGKPHKNSSWAGEISLDVEWAHAIAPGAQILLVETASNSLSNLNASRRPLYNADRTHWRHFRGVLRRQPRSHLAEHLAYRHLGRRHHSGWLG